MALKEVSREFPFYLLHGHERMVWFKSAKLFTCVILRLICVRSRQVNKCMKFLRWRKKQWECDFCLCSSGCLEQFQFDKTRILLFLFFICLTLTKHTVSFSLLRLCLPSLDFYIFPKNIKYFLVIYTQICCFNLLSLWVPKILPRRVSDPLTSYFSRVDCCKTLMCFSSVLPFSGLFEVVWSSQTGKFLFNKMSRAKSSLSAPL